MTRAREATEWCNAHQKGVNGSEGFASIRLEGTSLAALADGKKSCGIGGHMLWTIFVILLALWLIGLVSFHAIGAYIHILLVIALVVLLIQLFGGRRPVV